MIRPTMLVAFARRFLRSRGIEVMATDRANLLPLHLVQLFAKERIDHVLDVGAQVGGYASSLRRAGYAGPIWSFEPVTTSYAELARRAESDVRWRCINTALGASTGTARINVAAGSDFSSFLPPTTMALAAPHLRAVEATRVEEVQVDTLDELLHRDPLLGHRRIHLKLDTQGFDLEVLKGAHALLPFVRSIQTEVSLQAVYEGMPTFAESLATLADLGFAVTGFFPVSVNPDLTAVELDCVALRRDAAT